MIPYSRQKIDKRDIDAVYRVLKSSLLTTGPEVDAFENAMAEFTESRYAVAVSSGTSALHCAVHAVGIGPGDEVILPPITFAATANSIIYQGGTPVFADVDPETLLLDPCKVENKITDKTKAIIGVDYAGQPCDWDQLRKIAHKYNLKLVADACHAVGGKYKGSPVGSVADLNVFSFHPVKHIATGEGGMVTTNSKDAALKMRCFRNHGITSDSHQRERQGTWYYEMRDIGYNYRISDINCALGRSQLRRVNESIHRRQQIAASYSDGFKGLDLVKPLGLREDVISPDLYLQLTKGQNQNSAIKDYSLHAYHLYAIRIEKTKGIDRNRLFNFLRENGIGVNVHYIPVYLHPYYQKTLGDLTGCCPVAEQAYSELISIPMFDGLTDESIQKVIISIKSAMDD